MVHANPDGMDAVTVTEMLMGRNHPGEILPWLKRNYLPEIKIRLNEVASRKRLGIYGGERIPENERNLTDTRNRVSLILEYELARSSNDLFLSLGIENLFWSYVVANRFPDLEVRDDQGERGLRIEVKSLQSVAEEKSANFDTLLKDVDPRTDFIVVFLWEWAYDLEAHAWDRAPRVYEIFVFHAYSLALLRDCHWLNNPPNGAVERGLQGFDIRYAVNWTAAGFNEEEGNYGKLLRIWSEGFPYLPQSPLFLEETIGEYLDFRKRVVTEGFASLARFHLPILAAGDEVRELDYEVRELTAALEFPGFCAGDVGFFLSTPAKAKMAMREHGLRRGVALTSRYVCTGFLQNDESYLEVFRGVKPKHLHHEKFSLRGG